MAYKSLAPSYASTKPHRVPIWTIGHSTRSAKELIIVFSSYKQPLLFLNRATFVSSLFAMSLRRRIHC